MEEKFARVISVIFHPLLIPTYALIILINVKTYHVLVLPENFRYLTVLIVFFTSFVLPALIMLILLKMGKINSLGMNSQQERTLPLFIVMVFFYGTYYMLKQEPHFALFNIFMLGATLLVVLSLLINYVTKISIHMVAQGGLFGTFAGFAISFGQDFISLLSLIALVAGLTGYARLKLNAHTPTQVFLGFGVGVIFMLGLFLVL